MHTLLEAEKESVNLGKSKVRDMFTVPRKRRAIQASEIVMFMQQVKTFLYSSKLLWLKGLLVLWC